MKQLANALRSAGFRSTDELKAERDRAISALVKTRRQKRRGAKQLKARVLALVSALKVPAPIVTLLVLVAMPSLALAHPGHAGHGPDMNMGGALVVLGLTVALAGHAWANWGPRRRLVAAIGNGGNMAGGSPEPEPQPEPRRYNDRTNGYTITADEFERLMSDPSAHVVGSNEGGVSYRVGNDLVAELLGVADEDRYTLIPGFYAEGE